MKNFIIQALRVNKTKFFTLLFSILAGTNMLLAEGDVPTGTDPTPDPNPTYSGTCGTNLTWELTNSVLTIRGTGSMSYGYAEAPWRYYKQSIKSIVIEDGVTNIGDYAFQGCTNLTSTNLPNSLKSIGYLAFASCTALQSVTIPEGVTYIDKDAFTDCSGLTTVIWNAINCSVSSSSSPFSYPSYPRKSITTFVSGENVVKIPASLCNNMPNLATATILNENTDFAWGFSNCPNLVITVGSCTYTPLASSNASRYDTDGDGIMESISENAPAPHFTNLNNDEQIDFISNTNGTTLCTGIKAYVADGEIFEQVEILFREAEKNSCRYNVFQLDANLDGRMDFYSNEGVDKDTNPMGTHYFHLRQADGSYLKAQLQVITDTAAIDEALLQIWENSSGLTPMYWSTMPSISDGWMHKAPARNSKQEDSSLQPLMMRRATSATSLAYADFTSIDQAIDLDRNGLIDLMSTTTGAVLYNLGDNKFLMGQFPGQVTIKDLNGDGIMDYIIYDATNKIVTLQIYEGNGLFKTQTLMQNMAISNVWCYDFDNDGDVDILLPFDYTYTSGYAYLVFFRNDGNNTFKKVENAFDDPLWHFKFVDCKDVDNDGKYEILAVDPVTEKGDYYAVRYNDKMKVSVDENIIAHTSLTGAVTNDDYIEPLVADLNNDGILELIFSYSKYVNYLSHFSPANPNTAPAKMSKPRYILDADRQMINISWDRGSDAECSALDLEYSIRIGSASGKSDIWFAAAGADGKQRSLWGGNVGTWLNQWVNVAGWAEGDYYIAVQAIDPSGLGGAWSDEIVYHHSLLSADFIMDVTELTTMDTLTVQYHGVVNPAYSYTWSFGDSVIVLSQENQTYKLAYNTGGIKTISLQVTNAAGQQSPLVSKQVQVDAVRWDAMPKYDSFTYVDLDGDGTIEGFGSYGDDYYQNDRGMGFFTYKGNDEFKKVAKTYNTDVQLTKYNASVIYPEGLNVTDYNMDGLPDVVFPTNKGNVMLNQGDLDIEFNNDETITTYDKNPNEHLVSRTSWTNYYVNRDINGDGLADRIYANQININNGDGTYNTINPGYPSVEMGIVEDFNNDGYLDLCTWKNRKTLIFYLGDEDYSYSNTIEISLPGNYIAYIPWGHYESIVSVRDVDNNGYMDLFVRGDGSNFIIYLYPDWSVTIQPTSGFGDNDHGETRLKGYPFVDVNSDGIPDISYGHYRGYFLRSRVTNEAPAMPTNLRVAQTEKGLLCSWDAALDRETPAAQMRYNISIKKKGVEVGTDSAFIISPVNGLSDDAAIVPGYSYWRGTNFIVSITQFKVGQDYELQVQSIDSWGAHSAMTAPLTFNIEKQISISMPTEACKGSSVHINYIGTESGEQEWNFGDGIDSGNKINGYDVMWNTGGTKIVTLTMNGITSSRTIFVRDNDDTDLSFSLPQSVLSDTWVEFTLPNAFKDPSARIKMRTSGNIEDADCEIVKDETGVHYSCLGKIQRLQGTLKARVRFKRSESIESGWIEFYQEDAACGEKNNYRATTQVMGYAPAPQISIVTVDAATGKNCVIWDAPANLPNYIDKIYVYKEEGSTNNWVRQAEIALSAGQWIDLASDPAVRKNRYKITYGTNFGAESNKSTAHSSTHLQMNVGLQGANNLIWTKYEGGTIDSYRILRGTTPDNMTVIATVPGTEYTYTDLNSPEGVYYALEYDNLYFEKWVWITSTGAPAHMPAMATAATRNGHSNIMASAQSNEVTFAQTINICAMEKTIALNESQTSLHLYAEILPAMATYKRASWKIVSGADLATIDDNGLLVANTDGKNGTLRVRATAIDGSGIYAEKDIVVSGMFKEVLTESITLNSISGGTTLTRNNIQVIVEATVTPTDITNPALTWELLSGTDKVTISPNENTCTVTLLETASDGEVLLSATAQDGSGVYATISLNVSLDGATAVDDIFTCTVTPRKILINDQIYILRGDKTYTLQGQEVK